MTLVIEAPVQNGFLPLLATEQPHPKCFTVANPSEKPTPDFEVLSMKDAQARRKALTLIEEGTPFAFQMGTVFGIGVDSNNERAIQCALNIKQEPNKAKKWSTLMRTEDAWPWIDWEKMHPQLRWMQEAPHEAERRIGAMMHLQVPIREEALESLPTPVVSYDKELDTHFLQFLSPFGHNPVNMLVRETKQLLGKKPLAVTTLNTHENQAEITDLQEAEKFLTNASGRIPLLLTDPSHIRSDALGSFGIVNGQTLQVVRSGFVPPEVMEKLLSAPIDTQHMKASQYPSPAYPAVIYTYDCPEVTRLAVRLALSGKAGEEIDKRVKGIRWNGNNSRNDNLPNL